MVAPYLIMLTAFIAQAILAEASLSFLGLGVTEPTAAWGLMLSGNAADFYREAPWMILFPGAGDQPRGVRLQPVRRQPARLPRSALQGVTRERSCPSLHAATHCGGPPHHPPRRRHSGRAAAQGADEDGGDTITAART